MARSSSWVRAPESGILRTLVSLGKRVDKGSLLAVIADPFGAAEIEVRARHEGIVIGRSQLPLVHQGEAIYHVAQFKLADRAARHVEAFQETINSDVVAGDDAEPPIQ